MRVSVFWDPSRQGPSRLGQADLPSLCVCAVFLHVHPPGPLLRVHNRVCFSVHSSMQWSFPPLVFAMVWDCLSASPALGTFRLVSFDTFLLPSCGFRDEWCGARGAARSRRARRRLLWTRARLPRDGRREKKACGRGTRSRVRLRPRRRCFRRRSRRVCSVLWRMDVVEGACSSWPRSAASRATWCWNG